MTDVIEDQGWFPEGWISPVEDPALPWVVAYSITEPDPFPADRLDDEPAWDFEGAEDNGQNLRVAVELRVDHTESHDGRYGIVPSAVGINLSDYSRNPQGKGWGAPCSGQRATVRLSEAAVSVDARIAELVGLIMRAIEARGYRFRKADTGAYNCRKIAGTNTWSNHAWALAVDVNWQSNPFTATLRTDIPVWARHLFNRFGFAWGGDYRGRKDAMHFEFMGTPQQAVAALELARRELAGAPAPAPTPAPGSSPDVLWVQDRLNGIGFGPLGRDGISGPQTVAAIRAFQAAAGIGVDGDFGPLSKATSDRVPAYPGENAARFQQALKDRGWAIAVDGDWGPRSRDVLRQFQAEKGLDADGLMGPASWTALHTRPV